MAPPLSASTALAALVAEGLRIQEYRDWRNHNRAGHGAWGEVHGVMIHHTVSKEDDASVALCYNGHSALPGPLCHSVGRNDGKVAMVGWGRANHAGLGDDDVLRAVINETALPADNEANTDGNARFYGLEIVNLGDGDDTYPWKQYVSAVKWATALCRRHGWDERSVIGHKEWQPGKIDPYGPVIGPDGKKFDFTMGRFRSDVKAALALRAGDWYGQTQEEDVALTDQDIEKFFNADLVPAAQPPYANSDLATGNDRWTFTYAMYTVVMKTREAADRAEKLGAEVEALKAKLDSLAVGGVDLDALAVKVADELHRRLQG